MKCEVCGATPHEKPLYRCNPKGEAGRWMCEECKGRVGIPNVRMQPIDPTVKELVTVISRVDRLKGDEYTFPGKVRVDSTDATVYADGRPGKIDDN